MMYDPERPQCTSVEAYDIVLSVNGDDVYAVDDFTSMREFHGPTSIVKVRKAPFGNKNALPAEDRGWIYLERFISMIKVAMADDGKADGIIIASDDKILT